MQKWFNVRQKKLTEATVDIIQKAIDFDQRLIDRCEKLSHKQQRFTGKTHYFWLRGIAFAQCALCMMLLFYMKQDLENSAITLMLGFWALVYFIYGAWVFGAMEVGALLRVERRLPNPIRRGAFYVASRLCVGYLDTIVLMCALSISILLDRSGLFSLAIFTLWWLFTVLSMVLLACDPLPPTKGKVKEWVKSLFSMKASVPSPT